MKDNSLAGQENNKAPHRFKKSSHNCITLLEASLLIHLGITLRNINNGFAETITKITSLKKPPGSKFLTRVEFLFRTILSTVKMQSSYHSCVKSIFQTNITITGKGI